MEEAVGLVETVSESVDSEDSEQIKIGTEDKSGISFFLPSKNYFITPILVYINIAVFVLNLHIAIGIHEE